MIGEPQRQPHCIGARPTRLLGIERRALDGTFLCPGWPGDQVCPGGEMYRMGDPLTDGAMRSVLRLASAAFAVEAPPNFSTWRIIEPGTPRADLVPTTASDWAGRPIVYLPAKTLDQALYQAAHESVHLLSKPPRFHWTHELVAVTFALEALYALGQMEYRQKAIIGLEADAADLSLEELMTVASLPYPTGIYGRAFVFGRDLVRAVGPAGYRSLIRSFAPDGTPDYWGWVDSLHPRVRCEVIAISPPRPPSSPAEP